MTESPVDLLVLGYGRGRRTDLPQLLARCERVIRESPRGEIVLDARAERLITAEGRVCGAAITTTAGERRAVHARHTVLATGGFGGDESLRAGRRLQARLSPRRPLRRGRRPRRVRVPAARLGLPGRARAREPHRLQRSLRARRGRTTPRARRRGAHRRALLRHRARARAHLHLRRPAPAARVLDAAGHPVPGLLAAGADAGGVWFRAYAGGLATALVFGLQAADTALGTASLASSAPALSSASISS